MIAQSCSPDCRYKNFFKLSDLILEKMDCKVAIVKCHFTDFQTLKRKLHRQTNAILIWVGEWVDLNFRIKESTYCVMLNVLELATILASPFHLHCPRKMAQNDQSRLQRVSMSSAFKEYMVFFF